MSVLIQNSPPISAPHWKFTVEQFHLMGTTGILGEDDRVELIEGEIITMAPVGPEHASLSSFLFRRLGYTVEGRAIPWSQNPILLAPDSEPQPDFALLCHRPDRYKSRLPEAADVLLVEIADSSLAYDRDVKGPLYARRGIPEYWIVNLPERRVEVYTDPDPARARYRTTRTVTEGRLAPACFADVGIEIAELLG